MSSASTPKATRALVQSGSQKLEATQAFLPALSPKELLVRVRYVAQNPTDVQSFKSNAFGTGTVFGCDVVGIIEAKGSGVTRFQEGDKVAGLLWGGERKGVGGYSDYTILTDADIAFSVDEAGDGTSEPELASVPLASGTAELALFSQGCLAVDPAGKDAGASVFINGGSSSVGQYAIQLATLRGLKPYTTASSHHHEHLKQLGAVACIDYKSQDVLRELQDKGIRYAFDTIGKEGTSALCSNVVKASEGATICTVRPGKALTEDCAADVKVTDVLVWTTFLKEHRYGSLHWPANPHDHSIGKQLFSQIAQWIKEGKIKTNRVKVLKGLESVAHGFEMQDSLSGEKIVYDLC